MIGRPRARAFACALLLSTAAATGCGGEQTLVLVGGQRVDAATIDKDPLALLPGSIVALSYLDAGALFATRLGADTTALVNSVLPIGAESNFVPSRDVTRLYGGLYAMQGADYCFVVQGNFDVDGITRAADARAATPSGIPLVKSQYGGSDVYTVGNVGFVPLTGHTLLSGTETGMRRVLDRLRYGNLERSVPKWMVELSDTKGAAFALAADLTSQVPVAPALQGTPVLSQLRIVRVIGNFQSPGLNVAGTLTYETPEGAAAGVAGIQSTQAAARWLGVFAAFGFGVTLPTIDLAQKEKDVAFTMPVDEGLARALLRMGAQKVGK